MFLSLSQMNPKIGIRLFAIFFRITFLFSALLISAKNVYSQNLSTYTYQQVIFNKSDTISLSAFSIKPQSFQILSNWPDSCLELIWTKALIVRHCHIDSVKLRYLNYPWKIDYHLGIIDSLPLKPQSFSVLSERYRKQEGMAKKQASDIKITRQDGEFMRGITVGTNKNMSLNSNLDLSFEAEVQKNIKLRALIRDKQIPIQPDGVTANIEELNQIYFEMLSPKISFQAGDYMLENKNPLFAYHTKIKGIGIKTKNRFLQQETQLTRPKGEFKRQFLQAQNGNQIYRLSGKNGETPLIILYGSEKIYINGKRLKAGDNEDYVIDYNTGELRFTLKNLISSDMRIVAEFEYQTHDSSINLYQRSQINYHKSVLTVNYLGEWQNRQNFINSIKDSTLLYSVYRNTAIENEINISNYQLQTYSSSGIFYQRQDSTIGNQVFDSIFVFSVDSTKQLYNVQFSYVGKGKGDYVLDETKLNNPVYRWVMPLNSQKKGDYSPERKLKIPESIHRINFYFRQKLKAHRLLTFNFTQNVELKNRLSVVPNYQKSYIGEINFIDSLRNPKDTSRNSVFRMNVLRQSAGFKPIQSIFGVEFLRKWNLPDTALMAAFNKAEIYTEWTKKELYKQIVRLSTFLSKQYTLSKLNWLTNARIKAFELQSEGDFSLNLLSAENYFRQNGRLLYNSKVGIFSLNAQNEHRKLVTDSLNFDYNTIGIAWQNDSTKNWLWNNELSYHNENSLYKKQWMALKLSLQNKTEWNQLEFLVQSQYSVQNKDSAGQNYLNFNFNELFHIPAQWLQIALKKESAAILEPIYRFRYQKVAAGQGYFKWIDYNKNNLKEDGEFEPADFSADAQYLRFRIPTNENRQLFESRQEINLFFTASELFKAPDKFFKLLSFIKINYRNNWHTKDRQLNYIHFFYPDKNNKIYRLENNMFKFSYSLRKISFVYIKTQNTNLQELSYGLEAIQYQQKKYNLRYNSNKKLSIDLNFIKMNKQKQSEFLKSKNFTYDINSIEINPQITINDKFNLMFSNSYQQFINNAQVNFAQIVHSSLNLSYQLPKKSINLVIAYLNIQYQLPLNTALSYDILQTHINGNNIDLSLNFNIALNDLFSIHFSYQGRMAAKSLIHTGNIQIVAKL